MGKGSRSTQSGKQTIVNELPEYARPFYKNLMERTEAESLSQYTPYQGERIFGSNQIGDIAQSRDIIRNTVGQPIQGMDEAMAATRGAMGAVTGAIGGLDALRGDVRDASQYQTGDFNQFQYDPARQFTGDEVSQYMSPYMDAVVERQKLGAIKDFNRMGAARSFDAAKAGAFGGSRHGVADYLAQEGLQDQLADIESSGLQSAFQQAQQQFGADRAAQFAQQQAQAGELGRTQAATEASRQFGQQAGMAGLGAIKDIYGQQAGLAGQVSQLGGGLAALGGQERAAGIQDAQLLEGIGKSQLGEEQARLDLGYEDFLRQQGYNKEQLGFLSNILQGVPIQPNRTTTGYQPYNPMQQALGAGLAGLGLYRGMV